MTKPTSSSAQSAAAPPSSASMPHASCLVPSSPSTTWPSARFYWSILDLPAGAAKRIRPGPLPPGLRPQFEEDVPEPESALADLHAVCTPIDDDRLLVCAASNAALRELSADTLALTPSVSDLPEFIRFDRSHTSSGGSTDESAPSTELGNSAASTVARLNLLVGTHEPALFRRARARRTALALVTFILCAVLASLGLHQRAARDRALAAEHSRSAHDLAAPLGRGIAPADLPALVGRARQSAAAAAKITEPADASAPLAALLTAWPTTQAANVQTINVGGDVIAIALTIEGESAAADFLRAFAVPEGWMREEPRLTALGPTMTRHPRPNSDSELSPIPVLTRINLTLRRSAPIPHAAPIAAASTRAEVLP